MSEQCSVLSQNMFYLFCPLLQVTKDGEEFCIKLSVLFNQMCSKDDDLLNTRSKSSAESNAEFLTQEIS